MTYLDHTHRCFAIVNSIDDAIRPTPNPISIESRELLDTYWSGLIG
jgi:hypothetical protein